MNKKFLFGTFLLVALIFGISLIGFILLSDDDSTSKDDTNDNGSSVSSPVDTSSPTNTAEATDGTEDWIEYVDPDYGFSFKYPKEWEMTISGTLSSRQILLQKGEGNALMLVKPEDTFQGISKGSGTLFTNNFINEVNDINIGGVAAKIYKFEYLNTKLPEELKILFIDNTFEASPNSEFIGSASYGYSYNGILTFFSYSPKLNQEDLSTVGLIFSNFKWPK